MQAAGGAAKTGLDYVGVGLGYAKQVYSSPNGQQNTHYEGLAAHVNVAWYCSHMQPSLLTSLQAYDKAAPVVKEATDTAAPYVKKGLDVATEVAKPVIRAAGPVVKVSHSLLSNVLGN